MNNNNLLLLLQLIKCNADTGFLTKQGLVFSQISDLFGQAIADGLLKYDSDTFFITELGEQKLKDNSVKREVGLQGRWISGDDHYRISQISLNDVYLPKIKESYFF